MERQITMADLELEKVKENPAIITETMEKGYVPVLPATHDMANTVSCMAAEQLASEGRRFHEIYVAPQDTPENIRRKEKDVKDDETIVLVRHENEYSGPTMDAVWDLMFKYKARLVVVILKKKKKS